MPEEQTPQPPAIQQTKPSNKGILIWAILASAATVLCALLVIDGLSRLHHANDQLEQAITDLNQVKIQLEQAKIEISQLKPLAAKARKLPVTVQFRKAIMGAGYVLVLQSKAEKSLALSVKISNPTFANGKNYRVDLDPMMRRELGHAEGWAITSGDTLEIANAEYDPVKLTVP